MSTTTLSEKATLEPSSLFSQGMFYGFTIMLVLLNLACFFLFEEKFRRESRGWSFQNLQLSRLMQGCLIEVGVGKMERCTIEICRREVACV